MQYPTEDKIIYPIITNEGVLISNFLCNIIGEKSPCKLSYHPEYGLNGILKSGSNYKFIFKYNSEKNSYIDIKIDGTLLNVSPILMGNQVYELDCDKILDNNKNQVNKKFAFYSTLNAPLNSGVKPGKEENGLIEINVHQDIEILNTTMHIYNDAESSNKEFKIDNEVIERIFKKNNIIMKKEDTIYNKKILDDIKLFIINDLEYIKSYKPIKYNNNTMEIFSHFNLNFYNNFYKNMNVKSMSYRINSDSKNISIKVNIEDKHITTKCKEIYLKHKNSMLIYVMPPGSTHQKCEINIAPSGTIYELFCIYTYVLLIKTPRGKLDSNMLFNFIKTCCLGGGAMTINNCNNLVCDYCIQRGSVLRQYLRLRGGGNINEGFTTLQGTSTQKFNSVEITRPKGESIKVMLRLYAEGIEEKKINDKCIPLGSKTIYPKKMNLTKK